MEPSAVAAFVAAVDEYRVARGEQGRTFATRSRRDIHSADAEVRRALKDLIAELG